jgi:hemerythrin-like domain-containing protein
VSSLIETLTKQHKIVLELAAELEGALEATDVARANALLTQLREALLAHLELEDRQLYPELERAASTLESPSMQEVARGFSSNMARISEALIAFLRRYEGKAWDVARFWSDWRAIADVLKARIRAEEQTLYPLYQRALRKRGAPPI